MIDKSDYENTIDFSDGEGTAVLGIKNQKLYWNGELITTQLSLQSWVNIAIVIGAFATCVIAIVRVLLFLGYGYGI